MTMAEFNIRLFSFKRVNDRQNILTREISYSSYVGGSLNLKKIPSRNQYWPLEFEKNIDKSKLEANLEAMRRANKEYANRNKPK